MELTVTIIIDDTLITQSAQNAARGLFKQPEYGRDGGIGYNAVAAQVAAAVKSLDVSAIARETAEKYAKGLVEDVTKEAIKRMARETVKSMRDAGTLV